mgnify:CR=1 FL=1
MKFKTAAQYALVAVLLALSLGTLGVIAGLKLADKKE